MTDLQQALNLHRAGDLDAAEAAYRALLADSPDDADALHLLGTLLHKRGHAVAAEESIRNAMMLDPECAQFHLSLGGVLMQQGRDAEAHAAFERALELDPNAPEEMREVETLNARLVARALAMQGTCTGEHGIGIGKQDWLVRELGENAVDLMRMLKRALDPHDLFNPGKIFRL